MEADAASEQTFLSFDLEDAISVRELSDGRILGLFHQPPELNLITELAPADLADGRRMAVPKLRPIAVGSTQYVICINDDQSGIWWRLLESFPSKAAGQEYYAQFQEGQDDRRSGVDRRNSGTGTDLHYPERRTGGRRASDFLSAVSSEKRPP